MEGKEILLKKIIKLKRFIMPFNIERRWGVDDPTVVAYLAYWEPMGDECVVTKLYSNGVISGGVNDWMAFLELVQLNPTLINYNLGSSDEEPEYYLLIDKLHNKFYLVPSDVRIVDALKTIWRGSIK